jgi:hypothetical protein
MAPWRLNTSVILWKACSRSSSSAVLCSLLVCAKKTRWSEGEENLKLVGGGGAVPRANRRCSRGAHRAPARRAFR